MERIDRLLRPTSIAVVGGGTWCANVIEQCEKIGFEGEIWPVHPSRAEVCGRKAYARIHDLPKAPDAAFVGVNRDATLEVVADLRDAGAGGVVCFASGFREAQAETGDGAEKQEALLQAAGEMTILGPNCYGFVNYLDGAALWPDQHGGVRCKRGVAVITQSSNIGLNLTMQDRALPLAYLVTAGNQAQTSLSDIAIAVLNDPRVTALGLYVEGIGDIRRFEAMAAEAQRLGKPIVAVKTGRSEQARAGSLSHTASLAGSVAGASALLRRLGIGQVRCLDTLLETLKLLHVAGPLSSNRIASLSCSGGEASLMADLGHGSGLTYPSLDPQQSEPLRAALGSHVALANPLDYHTYIWGDEDALTATFTAMMQGDLAMGCVVLDFPRADRCSPEAWEPVIAAIARTKDATGRPMAVLSSLAETLPEVTAQRLMDLEIVPLQGMTQAIEAMSVAAELGQTRLTPAPLLLPRAENGGRTLSEAEAKALLTSYGVAVPKAAEPCLAKDASNVAAEIGFPVVLKGTGFAHKTEAGAVRLNLTSTEDVEAAARSMPSDTMLVEEMITGTVAELLIGVVCDPAHGYVLTLAAGGTLTELMEDSASLLVPTQREDVEAALRSLKVMALLSGYRGAPAADVNAVLDVVMAVQTLVTATKPQEIEINPLMCGTTRAVAADALIRTGDQDDR